MSRRTLSAAWINLATQAGKYLVAAIATLLPIGMASAEPPAGYSFVRFKEGIELAKTNKKPVFILFGFKGCPHCKLLEREIFDVPRQRELFEKYYTLIYVDTRGRGESADPYVTPDGDSLTRVQLEQRYQARGAPSWAFLNRKLEPILFGSGSGQLPSSFLIYHKYVLEEHDKKQSFKQYLRTLALEIETDSPGNVSR